MIRCLLFLNFVGLVVLGQNLNCNLQSDCGTDECCVHTRTLGGDHLELLGRKRLIMESHVGHCKPLRQLNETCLPFITHSSFNHELYESYCPCVKTLQCRGEMIDQGAAGILYDKPKCKPNHIT